MTVGTINIGNWPSAFGVVLDFDNTDLVAGVVTLTHSLNQTYVLVQVYDGGDNLINPDRIVLIDANTVTVDLSSSAPITGAWHAVIVT